MNRAAVIGRVWRGVADANRFVRRAGSASSALAALGNPDRSDGEVWMQQTAQQHLAYRAAHGVPDATVAIVCVSNRPHLLADIVSNVRRQTEIDPGRLDVVYVANYHDADRTEIESEFDGVEGVYVETPPAGTSLGAGLNRALARTDARFVAKFDDDDLYGPHHLADSLRAHSYCGAGVVGKHSYYAHFPDRDETVLRFPGREFSYSSTLAGGTLVIDRDSVGDQQFPDISLGEDRAFLAACHRRGISTFAADRFNFTQIRSDHNTWQPGDEVFLDGTQRVDPSSALHCIER